MPASTHHGIGPDRGAVEPNSAALQARAPAVDVERLAALVADGEVPWPDDLSAHQATELAAAVRRRRRLRLVKLIARQIAAELWRDKPPGARNDPHHL